MKKLKTLVVALGAVAMAGSAFAIPTLVISDGLTSTSLTSATGFVQYNNGAFDGAWQIVISTAETKPFLGSATSPIFDLNIQATSLGFSPVHNLTISFSDNSFTANPVGLLAQLSGHVVSGAGQPVSFNTYWDAGNTTSAQTSLLTSSGSLAGPSYTSAQTGAFSSPLYSLTELVTITGSATGGASYSLDASLAGVPDGGTTVMLLGAALSGLAFLRRKLA